LVIGEFETVVRRPHSL